MEKVLMGKASQFLGAQVLLPFLYLTVTYKKKKKTQKSTDNHTINNYNILHVIN